jgi:hypothetical protein
LVHSVSTRIRFDGFSSMKNVSCFIFVKS